VTRQLPLDDRIQTARLALMPVTAEETEELAPIFGDKRLYAFTGGEPGTIEELRKTFAQLAEDRAASVSAQLNWVVRRLVDRVAIGMLQAVFSDGGRAAEIAWVVGVPWQGHGFASEAARAVVAWLEGQGVQQVTAWIRPGHHASEAVATRAGLDAIDAHRVMRQHTEQLWRRQQSEHISD
jgi:RimJ/RimL family protein N-acetyltransferase